LLDCWLLKIEPGSKDEESFFGFREREALIEIASYRYQLLINLLPYVLKSF